MSFLRNLFGSNTVGVVSFEYGVVRAVVLRSQQGKTELLSSSEELLPESSPYVLEPLFEKRTEVISLVKRTLSDTFKSHPLRSVVVLVPDNLITRFITRTIKTNKNPSFDHTVGIKSHLEAELKLRSIEPLSAAVQYRVIHESEGLYELEVSVISKKDKEKIESLMEAVGYKHSRVESPLGILPAAYYEMTGEASLFVEFGEKETILSLGGAGVALSRTLVPVGVRDLAFAVSRFRDVSSSRAKELVSDKGFALGLKDDSGLQSELLLCLAPVFRETERILREHRTTSYRFPSERFIIIRGLIYGAGAHVRGLKELFSMRLRLPCDILDVTPHLRGDDDVLSIPAGKLIHFAPLVVAGIMQLKR
jgi:Tfp pilus assembly PilM family ATPase